MDVTQEQVSKMRHCIGLNYKKKPYRNYFYCTSPNPLWEDLVEKGLARKRGGVESGDVVYHLTYEAVKELYGKPISQKYYKAM